MPDKVGSYKIVNLSPGRRIWLNTLDMTWHQHNIYGLLEVDVSLIRRFIDRHKAHTGETLSFTGYVAYCVAQAVQENKAVQAVRRGRKQLIHFDDVSIGLMVEGVIDGQPALMGHVIREANHKSYLEIHREIREVQSKPVPSNRGMPGWFRSGMLLPWPLSQAFRGLLKLAAWWDPALTVAMGGTVSVTAIGMFGKGHSGWGISPSAQSLTVVVGSTTLKPVVVDGRIEPRDILNLTLVFDHDVIDGGPATRFTRTLVELIESGYGLDSDLPPTVDPILEHGKPSP